MSELIYENINKAAKERKILAFSYRKRNGQIKQYSVEPYSFRDVNGRKALYAYDIDSNKTKRFLLCENEGMDGIIHTQVLEKNFVPRNDWDVEIGK